MERILVFGYYNSAQKRKCDDEKKKEDEESGSKKTKLDEKRSGDSTRSVSQDGNFGKMILPDREKVVIDKKIIQSFTQKKKNESDIESHEDSDPDLDSENEEQQTQ